MQNLSKQVKIIIGLLIVLAISGIALLAIQTLQFRIVKSTPDTNNYPSSMGVLVLEFNEKLDAESIRAAYNKDAASVVKFSFNSLAYIEVYDKTLRITIQETPKSGSYKLNLNNIRSVDGSILSKEIPFIVKKIEYDQLSPEAQKLFDEYASEGETPQQDPIVKLLPHQTNYYKMSYIFSAEDAETPAAITITMKFFAPGDAAMPATPEEQQAYLNDVRKYRTEALDYLKQNGIDINRYIIHYTEPDLRNEFPSGYEAQPQAID